MSKKYLLIGAVPSNSTSSYGGTTVLVRQLKNYFDEKKIEYIFIQTNKYTGTFSYFANYLYTLFYFTKNIKSVDIVFSNVASKGMYFLAPLLVFISGKLNKRFISRVFAGNAIELYENTGKIKKSLIAYLFKKSNVLFFEPRYLVDYFSTINSNIYWFPNTRKKSKIIRDFDREFEKKFIFVGHIKKEKGIDELLEAFSLLDDSYQLTLYGETVEKKYSDELWKEYSNVQYGGPLKQDEVNEIMAKNDILILPSHREGYPGVIIEAFSVGLPIIATNLPGIQEMVEQETGILVDPRNAIALADAIKTIDIKNFKSLSQNSLNKFDDYKYENVYENIIDICEDKKV